MCVENSYLNGTTVSCNAVRRGILILTVFKYSGKRQINNLICNLVKKELLTPYSSYMFHSEDDSGMHAQILHIEPVPQDICSSIFVLISWKEYRAGLILCSEFEHEMPVFYRMK